MSITDELRDITKEYAGYKCIMFIEKGELLTIADRIDEQFDRICEQQENVLQATIEWIDEGYAELPKDADGMLIHIWDRMEHIELGYVCEVIAVGVGCFIAWNTHANRYCQYDSKLFRHHHEPTVEDLLEQFALEIDPSADIAVTGAETIKKFAKKLQLKEEA